MGSNNIKKWCRRLITRELIFLFSDIYQRDLYRFGVLLFFQITAAILPLASAWLIGHLLNTLIGHTAAYVAFIAILCCATLSASGLVEHFLNINVDYFRRVTIHRIKDKVLTKISSHPTVEIFEQPDMYNNFHLTEKSLAKIDYQLQEIPYILIAVLSVIFSLVMAFSIAWWIPCIFIFTMFPSVYIKTQVEKKTWDLHTQHATCFKQMNTFENLLISSDFAKEIRLYNMQKWILKKWNQKFFSFFLLLNQARKRGATQISAAIFLDFLGLSFTLIYLAKGGVKNLFTAGEISFLFGIIVQMRDSLSRLFFSGSEILQLSSCLKPILKILAISESCYQSIGSISAPQVLHKDSNILLEMQKVSFSYIGTTSPSLHQISLSIKKGEKIAIVGENGSGKTTFIKLLCRLYEPTEGIIFWKNQDIRNIEWHEYRSNIAALFQDFAKFPYSIRSNIDIRNILDSDSTVRKYLAMVGLNSLLGHQLDKKLWKGEEGGLQLSGGQWQRLAIARTFAMSEKSELVILDEPAAALDPKAEHDIVCSLKELSKGKTTVVISHRMSFTPFVDRILVFQKGHIVEEGSHFDLMNKNGHYASLYKKQASYYTSE